MKRFFFVATFFMFSGRFVFAQQDLPEPYDTWLNEEVTYIISEVEREAFLRLESTEEREAFIDAFWRKRDENPSTLENEYRTEHYERLEYANEFLGRDTFRKGWQTDMGRYHILLGAPRNRQNHEGQEGAYPTELWFYNEPALKSYGLPPFFYLLFFKRHGAGEFELYSPVTDGPEALLTGIDNNSLDFRQDVEHAYNVLFEIDPELAAASLSFRTDEGDLAQFQAPSFGTVSLLDQVANVPFYGLDTSYAERLDFERGSVESDYMFTFVPSTGMINILPGPGGAAYLHWVIELDPQHVAFVQDRDSREYATVFIASLEIVPKSDPNTLVVQYRRESFMKLPPSDEALLRRPFSYSGMTPVVPGEFDVRIILRNRACPGRDDTNCRRSYTLVNGGVTIPEWPSERPILSDLVLASETRHREGNPIYRAYRFGSLQVLPNPSAVYTIGDDVVVVVEPVNARSGSQIRFQIVNDDPALTSVTSLDETAPYAARGPHVQSLSLAGFDGGRYKLIATLLGGDGGELDTRTAPIIVSPRTALTRAGVRGSVPQAAPETPGVVALTLGEQYLALDQQDQARAFFEKAVNENQSLGPAREKLAALELDAGNVARALELLEPIYARVPDRFEVLSLLGQAYFHIEDYTRAVELLEKAIVLRRPPTMTLNVLARAQYRLGNKSRAEELLQRSLSIDPDQSDVRRLLTQLDAEGG